MDYLIRDARPDDIPDLAKLYVIGSHGLVDAIYNGLIPGKEVSEIIERRFHVENSTKSYKNCWVAEHDGDVIGDLHAHPYDDMADDPTDDLVPEERFAVAEPFDHLDHAGVGTYHINLLAVYPQYQGRGIGTRFMEMARGQARERGFTHMTLVSFEENSDAMRLYERVGFTVTARHPVVAHPLLHHGGDLVMLAAPV